MNLRGYILNSELAARALAAVTGAASPNRVERGSSERGVATERRACEVEAGAAD